MEQLIVSAHIKYFGKGVLFAIKCLGEHAYRGTTFRFNKSVINGSYSTKYNDI